MKKIFVGFPVLTGQVDVRFMDALLNTIRAGLKLDLDISPYFVTDDAIIQRVRNDIFHTAYKSGIQTCIFLDSDIVWKPEDLFKLLNGPGVVGATYRKKVDEEVYVGIDKKSIIADKYIETYNMGMGFVKIEREALVIIYENSPKYYDVKDNEIKRAIFQVEFDEQNGMISEDIHMFKKMKRFGIRVYCDTTIDLGHIGRKIYQSNLKEYFK